MRPLCRFPLVRSLLVRGDSYATELTDEDQLRALLRRLRPVSTAAALIRLGADADGGYLVPDDLEGIDACFSPGVSDTSAFERECAELGMRVFLADRSVERPVESHERFRFTRKHVGVTSGPDFMTMDDWVAESLPETRSELLVQMDIEGFEYETLMNMSRSLMDRIRVLVVEFHGLDALWSQPFFGLASRVFEKILQTHTCVHLHPNNCCPPVVTRGLQIPPVMEFTFLRSDRVRDPAPATRFPHPLDRDNLAGPHFPLPAGWYGAAG